MEQFTGNYTGPYWSDGKLQESVAFGQSEAASELDALSRLHDTAYAVYKDRAHRAAADRIYYEESQKLKGMFPSLAGHAVLYGNQMSEKASDIHHPFFPVADLVYHGIKTLFGSKPKSDEALEKQIRQDIQRLYMEDPKNTCKAGGCRPPTNVEGPPRGNSKPLMRPLEGLRATIANSVGKVTKAVSTISKTAKTPKIAVETKEQRNERLVQGQQRKFANYQNTYLQSLVPSGVPNRKRKKKKKNLHRATRILPPHLIY